MQAKKFVADLQAAHMQARTVYNQLQEHLTVLFPPAPPTKPGRTAIYLPRAPTFSSPDKALVGRWRKYLKWEESNPLETEDKDKSQLHARIQSVYRKAIVRMRYFPEIWCVFRFVNLRLLQQRARSRAFYFIGIWLLCGPTVWASIRVCLRTNEKKSVMKRLIYSKPVSKRIRQGILCLISQYIRV